MWFFFRILWGSCNYVLKCKSWFNFCYQPSLLIYTRLEIFWCRLYLQIKEMLHLSIFCLFISIFVFFCYLLPNINLFYIVLSIFFCVWYLLTFSYKVFLFFHFKFFYHQIIYFWKNAKIQLLFLGGNNIGIAFAFIVLTILLNIS